MNCIDLMSSLDSSAAYLSSRLTFLLALAVGVIAANLYYAQPLTTLMARTLGLSASASGLVVTLTQIGYGLGVLCLVPLGDLRENRQVILVLIAVASFALVGIGTSQTLTPYLLSAFFLGVGASAVQLIVPFAAHLSLASKRGQVVGKLMSGLMLGIMLSRPIASLVADLFSWNAVFYISALLTSAVGILLAFALPKRHPANPDLHYFSLLRSMSTLFFQHTVLRRRALYQGCMFAAFCLFWTATPMVLASDFHLTQTQIAVFALVGVSGAVFAPLAGRAADRGHTQRATTGAFVVGGLSFLLTFLMPVGSTLSLAFFTVAAILLDAGVSANLVLGQRAIFTLPAELRGRLNSLYIATIFIGGSFGSFVGAWAFAHGGWVWAARIGLAMPFSGLLYFATEKKSV